MWIHEVWEQNFRGELLSTYIYKLQKEPVVGPRVTHTR